MRSGLISGLSNRRPRRLPGGGAAPGPAPYTASATNFDGTNDYIRRAGALTSVTDTDKGILSFWVDLNNADSVLIRFLTAAIAGRGIDVQRSAANALGFSGTNAAGDFYFAESIAGLIASGGWRHILFAWDTSVAGDIVQGYLDDLAKFSTSPLFRNGDVDYTQTDWGIGATTAGASKLNGCLSEFYFNTDEYLDISVEANRRLFITAAGKPVDLGADGSTPTGNQPAIYLPNPFGTFEGNAGYGGDFSVTGALTACADSPSD